MNKPIIILFFTFISLITKAQTIIEGAVLDAQGKAVDAYVTVTPKGTSSILTFADTDAKGHYRLVFTTQADSLIIKASGLSIGNQARVVPNRTQQLNFHVKEKDRKSVV